MSDYLRGRPVIANLDGKIAMARHIAVYLDDELDINALLFRTRASDTKAHDFFLAVREVAQEERRNGSAAGTWAGTVHTSEPEPAPELSHAKQDLVTSSQAVDLIGMTDRAIRKAVREGRLPGKKVEGRYLIKRRDALTYRSQRRGAA